MSNQFKCMVYRKYISKKWLQSVIMILTGFCVRVEAAAPSQIHLEGCVKEVEAAPATGPINTHKAFISRNVLNADETATRMEFEVALKMRNFSELQTRLAQGEHISVQEMAEKYNPSYSDYEKVNDWLSGAGFEITRQDKNHLAVFARGKVSRIQQTMLINFARVTSDGAEYTSAISTPSVPASIAPLLVGINGLQPYLRMHKHLLMRPNSLNGTNAPYLPSQIAKAYNANGLYGSSITGAGQAIAIVIDTFPRTSDLTSFWSTYGVNQSLSNVSFIQVIPGSLPVPEGEETLDTEWSSSLAPGAKVRVYAACSLEFSSLDQTYQQVYIDATTHPEYGIHQMSMSYGIGEQYITNSQVQTDDQYFAELTSAGVTVFASSGDSGSTPGPNGAGDESGPLQASSPSTDPNVTCVGGTSLTLKSDGTENTEVVWNSGSGASGGGTSIYFSRPYWQAGTGVTAGTMRMTPDISSAADPSTGAVLILNGSQTVVGGTSWSSPTWAAFCALFNQDRANNSLSPLGLLQPYLYPFIGTANFRDITGGNNATYGSGGRYSATVGYDETTGIGVPNVQALAQTFLSYTPILPRAPVITSAPPPVSAQVNAAYSFTYTTTGFPTPTFSLASGNLPPGLHLGSAGLLSGVPTQAGAYSGSVIASNGVYPAASQAFTITVFNVPTAPVFTDGPPPVVATVTLPYSFQYTASGYPAPTFTITAGSLPPNVTLSVTGLLSGAPTQTGIYSGTVTASNGVSPSVTQNFTITVQQPAAPVFSNGPPPATAQINTVYNFTYTATGAPAPSFSLTAGNLPPGLSFSSGVISGTPTQTGVFTGTVTASNGINPAATQNFSITVQQAPAITNAPFSGNIAVNNGFSFAYQATGYPVPTFSLASGSLPPGLSLSSAGVLSGTPTQMGAYTGVIKATNTAGNATQNFSINVVSQAFLTLSVNLPGTVNEGDPDGQGTVSIGVTSSNSLTVQLTSSNTGALTLPATVIIPAGQTSVVLPYTIIDNLTVYGTQTTTVTAHASGWVDAQQIVTVTDNKTTDNWSTFGNGQAHTGVYPGLLLGGVYQQAWSAAISPGGYITEGLNQAAVAKGLVYVTPIAYPNATTMTVLNAATGAPAWQHVFSSAYSINPPTVYKGNVYVQRSNNSGDTNLWSLNAASGAVNWSAPFNSQWEHYLAPTIYQSIGIWMDGGSSGGLYGFNFNGTQRSFTSEPQSDEWTPTYYGGTIYSWVANTFSAINPATGAVLWSVTEPGDASAYDMNCAAPIANNLAFLNGTTAFTAVNVSTHAAAWSLTGAFTGTPAVNNGKVYVISGSQVKILNANTGATISILETLDNGLTGQPVLATDSLVVSSSSSTYLFNLQTGALVQTIPYGGPVSVAGGVLYLAGNDDNLRAYRSSAPNFYFPSANSIGLSSYGFSAASLTANFTLGFVPAPGTVLTVINNTSSNPINGAFSNLSNGGTVNLVYNGTTYGFIANYYGGDGNDLTLTFGYAPPQAPAITNGPAPTFVAVNTPYNFTYIASGYPAPTFSLTSGSLPQGVALSPAGVLSGTPTHSGLYTGIITATNSVGSVSQNFSINVQANLILTVTLPNIVNEGDPDGQGTLASNATLSSDLTVQLTSSNTGALTLPASVTIPAGQTSIALPYTIIDNLTIYGTQTATVTAHASGWIDGNGLITITDNKTTDNWSSFGNGQAHTGVYLGPLLWGSFYTQAWSATFPSATAPLNQVAVAKGVVYVTPNNSYGVSDLTALNASDGTQLWQYAYGTGLTSNGIGYFSVNPPTVYKGNVYVQLGFGLSNGGSGSLPPKLWSLNAATGHVNWIVPYNAQAEFYMAPTVYQSIGIWMDGGSYGGLYNFDFNGNQLSFTSEAQYDQWTPTYYNGIIYSWVGGTFTAVNPASGAVLWSITAPYSWHGWSMNCAAPIANNLAFLNGSATLTAVNVSTHAIAWSLAGAFTGTPAVNNDKVYVISGSQVLILNANTGAILGALQTSSNTGLAGQPVVATDSLIVSSSTNTYLFNLQTGALVQTIPYGGPVSVAQGKLYLAGSDGSLRVYQSSLSSLAAFTQWEALYFTPSQLADPAVSGSSAIPQHDGIPNLFKYLFDINPSHIMTPADRAALPVMGMDTTTTPGTEYLTLQYRQFSSEAGLTINVQISSNLQVWQTVIPNITKQIGVDSITGDPIMKVEVNVTGNPRMFIRLNVTSP